MHCSEERQTKSDTQTHTHITLRQLVSLIWRKNDASDEVFFQCSLPCLQALPLMDNFQKEQLIQLVSVLAAKLVVNDSQCRAGINA